MKTLPDEALDLIAGDRVIVCGAVRFRLDRGDFCYWGAGVGTLTLGTEGAFIGLGDSAIIAPVASAIGSGASGIKLGLNGLDADIADMIMTERVAQRPATLWRLIFNPTGRVLVAWARFHAGRCEAPQLREVVGGKSTVEIGIEGSSRDLSRAGTRMRSDPDQRLLGGATDGGMKHIGIAADRQLSWGGKPATAGIAVNGGFIATGVGHHPGAVITGASFETGV